MRAHYLQHVPFEGLGSIEPWLTGAGYTISHTPFYESAALPGADEIDFLVVMGGPMSINDEQRYPWLVAEKQFIREVMAAGIPTLGICLGAQLIASALGARVYPGRAKEIGWFPVQGTAPPEPEVFAFPAQMEVFHWHGETFELPPGAVRLARSPVCDNQAFQIDRHIIGLQFHLETTPDSAAALVAHCRDELVAGDYIQTEADILAAPSGRYRAINQLMADILHYLQRSAA